MKKLAKNDLAYFALLSVAKKDGYWDQQARGFVPGMPLQPVEVLHSSLCDPFVCGD
jgi:hypothetical protein